MLFYRTDTPAEVELVKSFAKQNGAYDAVICSHWARGGAGAADLAAAVEAATSQPSNFKFLYDVKVGWQLSETPLTLTPAFCDLTFAGESLCYQTSDLKSGVSKWSGIYFVTTEISNIKLTLSENLSKFYQQTS